MTVLWMFTGQGSLVPGAAKGLYAANAVFKEALDRYAVVLESKLAGDEEAEKDLRKQVTAQVVDAVGVRPSAVLVLKPGTLPKTPSGKLKRSASAALVPAE